MVKNGEDLSNCRDDYARKKTKQQKRMNFIAVNKSKLIGTYL